MQKYVRVSVRAAGREREARTVIVWVATSVAVLDRVAIRVAVLDRVAIVLLFLIFL